MLELFDMYVDGIDPQRTGDLEEIKKNVGIMLRIEGQELERLFWVTVRIHAIMGNSGEY
jgi:hypothetical protein